MDKANGWQRRSLTAVLLFVSVGLWALHYVHLDADFPHNSPWVDPAPTTDEGWYAGAAIRHYLSGTWRVDGDFNPAVALPVFPVAAGVLFHFTSVSAVALRAMSCTFSSASLVVIWLLMRRYSSPLAAAFAIFVIACSPFFYAYARLGILEPMLTLEILLALLAASYAGSLDTNWRSNMLAATTGILLAVMVLTKTTGVCAIPAAFLLMALNGRLHLQPSARRILIALGVAGLVLGVYVAVVIKTGLFADFRNLFRINNDHVHGRIVAQVTWKMLKEGAKTGRTLYVLSAAVVLPVLIAYRRTLSPLLIASCAVIFGFGIFIAYHGWLVPRYYFTCLPFLAMALAMAIDQLASSQTAWVRVVAYSSAMMMAAACVGQMGTLTKWTLHPDYSYANAGMAFYSVIDNDPGGNRVVLGKQSEQLALLTSERGTFINPVFSTVDIRSLIASSHPGWLVTADRSDDAKVLDGLYALEAVKSVRFFCNDGRHDSVTLYRLVPR